MGFKKGQSGNVDGRPKGIPNKQKELMDAIRYVQGRKGKKLLVHAIEQAYDDNAVLMAVLKKLVPDRKFIEADIPEGITVNLIQYGNRTDDTS